MQKLGLNKTNKNIYFKIGKVKNFRKSLNNNVNKISIIRLIKLMKLRR